MFLDGKTTCFTAEDEASPGDEAGCSEVKQVVLPKIVLIYRELRRVTESDRAKASVTAYRALTHKDLELKVTEYAKMMKKFSLWHP